MSRENPKIEVIYLELKGEATRFKSATIAKAILNFDKLYRGVSKNLGQNVETRFHSIEIKDGEIKIGFTANAINPSAKTGGK